MVTTLLIDTCVEVGFVALAVDGKCLFIAPLSGREGAQELLPRLAEELQRTNVSLKSVELIGVTCGPGSYTGLRLGVIAAEALAYALKVPLVSVPSLNTYGLAADVSGSFAVLLDARIGGLYVALGHRVGASFTYSAPQLCSLAAFSQLLGNTTTLVTPHRERLQQRFADASLLDEGWLWYDTVSDPDLMMEQTKALYAAGHGSQYAAAQILYLRPTQAEIENPR